MALELVSASSQYAFTASPGITDQPFTASAWVKPASSTTGGVCGLFDTAVDNNYYYLNCSSSTPRASSDNGAGIQSALWGSSITTDVWTHLLGHFGPTTGTDRAVSAAGGTFVTSTTNRAATSLDTLGIGARKSASPSVFFNGRIAHVGVWNVQLSQGECLALARGVSPFRIRPGNLIHYFPFYNHQVDFARGNATLTLNGSPSFVGDMPPVEFWTPRSLVNPYAVAAGGTTFNQSLTATSTTTATITRVVNFTVSATSTTTATIVKAISKALSATSTSTATLSAIKVILVTLSATATTTATMVRSVGKTVSATSTTTASITKQVAKTLSTTATTLATIATTFIPGGAAAVARLRTLLGIGQ